ncbi:MAG TPA: glycosyltransferase [Actinomycetota bacterium]|nr:glycosyltransferase [Actinomycetota bacterium]
MPRPADTRTPRRIPGLVSVVMPARNAASTIERQLIALSQQSYSGVWELIVVDDGSEDDTRAAVRVWMDRMPNLVLLETADHRGPCHARNVGMAGAKGDLLLFCDADDECSEEWITEMVRAAENADLVGGAIATTALNDPVVRAWRGIEIQVDRLPVGGFLPYSLSANLGVWAYVIHEVGGWDESFRTPGGDDVDLCWRAQLGSFVLEFAPRAIVNYRYRSSLKEVCRQHLRYGMAGALLFRKFRTSGYRRPSSKATVGAYVSLMLSLPSLFAGPERRGSWLRRASHRLGRVVGSVRHGVVFL